MFHRLRSYNLHKFCKFLNNYLRHFIQIAKYIQGGLFFCGISQVFHAHWYTWKQGIHLSSFCSSHCIATKLKTLHETSEDSPFVPILILFYRSKLYETSEDSPFMQILILFYQSTSRFNFNDRKIMVLKTQETRKSTRIGKSASYDFYSISILHLTPVRISLCTIKNQTIRQVRIRTSPLTIPC